MKDLTNMLGHQWLVKKDKIPTGCQCLPAIKHHHCNRCGSLVKAKLPDGRLYCRACLEIGRATEGDVLVRYPRQATFAKRLGGGLTWRGKLTPAQAKISDALVKNFRNKMDSLVHAVTGAGKTEMLFSLLATCLAQGKRAAIATPRIDVVNELFPRLQRAFISLRIGKYHGREFNPPTLNQLTICTTHQLLKFYQAFDLLIIDEVDAFPYVDNQVLHFGAKQAVKSKGQRVYLTATPTEDLLQEVHEGKLKRLLLRRRFHNGLLPVPEEQLFFRPF